MTSLSPNVSFVLVDGTGSDSDLVLPEAQLNPNFTKLDSIIEHLRNPDRCKVEKTSNQVILDQVDPPSDIHFGNTVYNVGGMSDLANDRIVVQRAGFYIVRGNVRWEDGITGTARKAILLRNGTTVDASQAVDTTAAQGSATNKLHWAGQCSVGDFFKMQPWHNNGAPLDITTNFGGTWLEVIRLGFSGLGD